MLANLLSRPRFEGFSSCEVTRGQLLVMADQLEPIFAFADPKSVISCLGRIDALSPTFMQLALVQSHFACWWHVRRRHLTRKAVL